MDGNARAVGKFDFGVLPIAIVRKVGANHDAEFVEFHRAAKINLPPKVIAQFGAPGFIGPFTVVSVARYTVDGIPCVKVVGVS